MPDPSDESFADLFGKLPDARARGAEPASSDDDAAREASRPLTRREAREAAARAAGSAAPDAEPAATPTPVQPAEMPTPDAPAPRAAAPSATETPAEPLTKTPAAPRPAEKATPPRAEASAPVPASVTPASAPAAARTPSSPAAASPSLEDLFTGNVSTDELGEHVPQRQKRERGARRFVALGIVVVLLAAIGLGGAWAWGTYGDRIMDRFGWGESKDYEAGLEGDPVFVRVADGASGCSVSPTLFDAGVTKRSDTVCDALMKSGENPQLHPGVFELRERMPAADALAILTDPANIVTGAMLRAEATSYATDALAATLAIDRAALPDELPAPFAEGGFLVSDAQYLDATALDQEQIRAFVADTMPACDTPDCLKDATVDYAEVPSNAFCEPLEAASGQDVAAVIERVATACGLSPKVLMVLLHEQLNLDLDQLAAQMTTPIASGGFIISDADFFDSSAMSADAIQAFLDRRVPTCDSGYTCLKDYTTDHPDRPADQYCAAMAGGSGESAAQIISKAAVACSINPEVLLIMLEKEQALVTRTNPEDLRFERAMGQSCPDTGEDLSAECDPAFAGFAMQVWSAARQMQIYTANPYGYQYRAGEVNTIQWHPSPDCGVSEVYIENQATANLYIYTPYRPNVAALAAGWGGGDSCSAYGNRNFYNLYVEWFNPQLAPFLGIPAQVQTCTVPNDADIRSTTGTAIVSEEVAAREAPSELCSRGSEMLAEGTQGSVTGVYGAWWRVDIDGREVWLSSHALTLGG